MTAEALERGALGGYLVTEVANNLEYITVLAATAHLDVV